MSSNYWAKVFIEMLDDRKTATLPDSSWRRFVECILLAKELDESGFLPSVVDMAWRLRIDATALSDDLTRLALAGLLELREGDRWFVTNFTKRQEGMSGSERVARHRQQKRKKEYFDDDSNDDVTDRYTEKRREEKNREEGEIERAAPATLSARPMPKKSPPPPKVQSRIPDRTPGGYQSSSGYGPPPEPESVKQESAAPNPVIGEMANAITDVTGISARLNWSSPNGDGVGDLAAALANNGYTPAQVRTAYSRQPTAGAWHWYTAHWKGKKGDPPTLKDIRETIAGATARPTTAKKPGPIERALAMLGNQPPDPATA